MLRLDGLTIKPWAIVLFQWPPMALLSTIVLGEVAKVGSATFVLPQPSR